MKKSALKFKSETIRQLSQSQLHDVNGGYFSIPCGTRGCSIPYCPTDAPTCVGAGCTTTLPM
jgi:hypothetical protein